MTGCAASAHADKGLSNRPPAQAPSVPTVSLTHEQVVAAVERLRASRAQGFEHDDSGCAFGDVTPAHAWAFVCERTRNTPLGHDGQALAELVRPLGVDPLLAPTCSAYLRGFVCNTVGTVGRAPVSVDVLLPAQNHEYAAWTYVKVQVVSSLGRDCPQGSDFCVVGG